MAIQKEIINGKGLACNFWICDEIIFSRFSGKAQLRWRGYSDQSYYEANIENYIDTHFTTVDNIDLSQMTNVNIEGLISTAGLADPFFADGDMI